MVSRTGVLPTDNVVSYQENSFGKGGLYIKRKENLNSFKALDHLIVKSRCIAKEREILDNNIYFIVYV